MVWLSEKNGNLPRLLPIPIGEFEAAAIRMRLENDGSIRPISYDLLASMVNSLAIRVHQVVIHNVRRSIYYARVVIEKNHTIKDIDARPSDAIALALRTGSPIYVAPALLDEVGLEPLETDLDVEHTLNRSTSLKRRFPRRSMQKLTRPRSAHRSGAPKRPTLNARRRKRKTNSAYFSIGYSRPSYAKNTKKLLVCATPSNYSLVKPSAEAQPRWTQDSNPHQVAEIAQSTDPRAAHYSPTTICLLRPSLRLC